MSPTVLVIEHEPACGIGRLGRWLRACGCGLTTCRPYAGDALPARVEQDGLVVLGGHMGAWDDAEHAWLPAVRRLLADAVAAARPTLGVCLGGQLLAAACGGRVEPSPTGPEAGVVDVRWRSEATSDVLVAGLSDPFPGPSMHHDHVVELPAGAVWLGETAVCRHQVFRIGSCAWGVQFHPEVPVDVFAGWAASEAGVLARWGIDGAAVVAQLRDRDREVVTAGRGLARRFAGVVVGAHPRPAEPAAPLPSRGSPATRG